jgi:hypothetical protein
LLRQQQVKPMATQPKLSCGRSPVVVDVAPPADAPLYTKPTMLQQKTPIPTIGSLQNQRIAFDSIQKIKQINFTKSLFEKGFVAPTSSK